MRKLISMPGAIALLTSMIMVAPFASAQGTPDAASTPETDIDVEAEVQLYPAHIHSGTCDELGDVVYPLEDLQAAAQVADPEVTPPLNLAATPDAEDVMGPFEVAAQSGTEVDASLEELLVADFAINVHASAEDIETYIACGEITGTPDGDELFIELRELNNSGFEGRAELSDQGDGTTIVNVAIYPIAEGGTPEATPAS